MGSEKEFFHWGRTFMYIWTRKTLLLVPSNLCSWSHELVDSFVAHILPETRTHYSYSSFITGKNHILQSWLSHCLPRSWASSAVYWISCEKNQYSGIRLNFWYAIIHPPETGIGAVGNKKVTSVLDPWYLPLPMKIGVSKVMSHDRLCYSRHQSQEDYYTLCWLLVQVGHAFVSVLQVVFIMGHHLIVWR